MPIGVRQQSINASTKAAGETTIVKDDAIKHSSAGEDSEKEGKDKRGDGAPKYDLSVAADVHKTGKILNLKHTKMAAIKEGSTTVSMMTLQESITPH